MAACLTRVNHHYLVNESEIKKKDSLYELSLVYSKNLSLLRLPFRSVSTLLGWAKILPISSDIKAVISAQDAMIRKFNSTLKLPKFFISQIGFYHSCSELNREMVNEKGGRIDLSSPLASRVFYSSLNSILASIKFLQLTEKFKWTRLSKISTRLPIFLTKSSNILTVFFVVRGLLNSVILLNRQVREDYSSQTWASSGPSPKTIKTIKNVVSKSLNFMYVSATTASLFFGVCTSPVLLMTIAAGSLFLNLSASVGDYKKMIWANRSAPVRDLTTHLPA